MSLSKIFVNSTQIVGVDNEPTAESDNLVKSGGVFNELGNLNLLTGLEFKESSKDLVVGTIYHGRLDNSTFHLADENYIKVLPNLSLNIIKASDILVRITEYDENKVYITQGGEYYQDITTVITKQNTKFIRISASYSQRGFSSENPITLDDYQEGDFGIIIPQSDKIDEVPTDGSNNLVKSGGVKAALIKIEQCLSRYALIGKGDTYSASNFNLIKERTYKIVLDNPNWLRDQVTSSYNLFQVASFTNNVETRLVSIPVGSTLLKLYTFTVPENSEYIRIGCRANNGVEVLFELQDITNFETEVDNLNSKITDLNSEVNGVLNSGRIQINNGWMDSAGKVSLFDTNHHFVVEVNPDDSIALKKGSENTYYAFLKSYQAPTENGQSFDFCEGESRRSASSDAVYITLPEDVKYLYIGLGNKTTNSYKPEFVLINGVNIINKFYNTKRELTTLVNTALPAATHIPTENPEFCTLYCKIKKGDIIYVRSDIENILSNAITIQMAFFNVEPYIGMDASHILNIVSTSKPKAFVSNYDGYFAVHFRFYKPEDGRKVKNVIQVLTTPVYQTFDKAYIDSELKILNEEVNKLKNYRNDRIYQLRNSYNYPMYDCHRGVQAFGPENSLPAFLAGGVNNVWAIETDFQMTSDGVVVCMHDSTINRTMRNMDGTTIAETVAVSSKTLAELRTNYKIGEVNSTSIPNKQYVYSEFDDNELVIPTMDDYFDICQQYGLTPFIELKSDGGIIDKMIASIKKHDLVGRCVVSSFSIPLLTSYRNKGGNDFIHHIISSTASFDALLALGKCGVSFDITNYDADITDQYVYKNYNPSTTKELVAMCHELGILVCFRAVDNRTTARKAIEIGLNYMPTNNLWLKSQID